MKNQDFIGNDVSKTKAVKGTVVSSGCKTAAGGRITSGTKKVHGSKAARKSAKKSGFVDILQKISLKDKRGKRTQKYTAAEIMLSALFSVAAGAISWYDTESISSELPDTMRKYLPFKNEVPSHDTLNRFFQRMEPSAPEDIFSAFLSRMTDASVKVRRIHIDDMQINGATKAGGEIVHMVTARSSELKISLGQLRVNQKTDEIKAIPLLSDVLDLKGVEVTIDAVGAQTEIIDLITKKKGIT